MLSLRIGHANYILPDLGRFLRRKVVVRAFTLVFNSCDCCIFRMIFQFRIFNLVAEYGIFLRNGRRNHGLVNRKIALADSFVILAVLRERNNNRIVARLRRLIF